MPDNDTRDNPKKT